MIRTSIAVFAALSALLLGVAPRTAVHAAETGTLYTLVVPPSSLTVGCQGPCECPVLERPTYGSFELIPTGSDPLYNYYSVERYIASFNNGPGAVAITGSGQYKIGGEFALVHQLTLDLQVEGGPRQHFDSGLKPVGAPYPQIDIACAVHGFACYDSVLEVRAKPVDLVSAAPTGPRPSGVETVRPNPFARSTAVVLRLDRASPIDLAVFDLAGRRVRQLAASRLMDAGDRTVVWDGLRDDGLAAPAGVYWLRMRWPGGLDGRRLVKLD